MELIGYASLFLVGLILGALGGGGAILSVPIMIYLFSMDVVSASAYSLFIVGNSALVGSILKYKSNLVNIKTAFVFGMPSVMAIFITRRWIVPAIPDVIFYLGDFMITKRILVLGVFSLMMIIASISMIQRKRNKINLSAKMVFEGLFLGFSGILVGVVCGLVGAGGGFLILPVLVGLSNIPFKAAVGTSLLIITINSYLGFIGDTFTQAIDWHFLFAISAMSIFGMLAGIKIGSHLPAQNLQRFFGWFTLAMGSFILIKELGF